MCAVICASIFLCVCLYVWLRACGCIPLLLQAFNAPDEATGFKHGGDLVGLATKTITTYPSKLPRPVVLRNHSTSSSITIRWQDPQVSAHDSFNILQFIKFMKAPGKRPVFKKKSSLPLLPPTLLFAQAFKRLEMELKDVFESIDKNRDGKIYRHELLAAIFRRQGLALYLKACQVKDTNKQAPNFYYHSLFQIIGIGVVQVPSEEQPVLIGDTSCKSTETVSLRNEKEEICKSFKGQELETETEIDARIVVDTLGL